MATTHFLTQFPCLLAVAWAAGSGSYSPDGLDAASFLQVAAGGTPPVDAIKEAAIELMKEQLKQQGELIHEEISEQGELLKDQERILSSIVGVDEVHESGREPAVEAAHAAQNSTQVVEHIAEGRVLGGINRSDPWATTLSFLDLAATDTALKGFRGGFTDGTYGYAVPQNNGGKSGKVARFDLADFATVAVLDLEATDAALVGFNDGFTDGTYGYVVPYKDNAGISGKMARFDLAGFAAVAVLDLAATDAALKCFYGGFTDGTYGYVNPGLNGKVARFDLAGFAAVAVLDLTATDTALKYFRGGGFTAGTYGYMIHWDGKTARFDLASFAAVAVLDLKATATALSSFYGGFTDGTYGYAVPHHNGQVARFDLADFATVGVLDLTATDAALRGFLEGFIDGTYGYLVPFSSNGEMAGKVARFDLAGFAAVAVLDLAATDSANKGFHGGFTDGTYGYVIPWANRYAYRGKVARFGVLVHILPSTPTTAVDPNDQASVIGDPHVVNVAQVKFEIRAAGVHKLLQIPQFIRSNGKPDLRVDAEIRHLVSHDCGKSFMTSASIFGLWTEDAFGLLRISPGSDAPNTTMLVNTQDPEEFFKQFPRPEVKAGRESVTFKLRDVGFHVSKHYEGRYGKQRAYLNLRIAGLKKFKDLGGLLGYDDHVDAEKPSADCTAAQPPPASRSSFVGSGRSVPGTAGGSRIEAE